MIPCLPTEPLFPPVEEALSEPNGLLALGGDLSCERLLVAYRQGIFPWFAPGNPILWWSPDPRMVLFPQEIKIRTSLARSLRNSAYEVRLDTAFDQVLQACADTPRPGQDGTWITPDMQKAYQELHRLGHAHSVETWIDGQLAGGLYGVAIGRVFYGESMFSARRDASKIALAHLCLFLARRDFGIIDCQMETAHLASMGARPISRQRFRELIGELTVEGEPAGIWPAAGILDAYRNASGRDRRP